MSKNLETLRENNDHVLTVESYIIDNHFYVSNKGLAALFGVQQTSMSSMRRKGLEKADVSIPRLVLYDVDRSITWYKNNIDKKQAQRRRTQAPQIEEETSDDNDMSKLDLDKVPKMEAERRKEIEAVKKLMMQNKILNGENISIDDVDKNLATQAATHISHLSNSEKILPNLLENKSASDIQEILNEHNQMQIEQLYRITNKELQGESELFDIFMKVIDKIDDGASVEDLIKGVDKIVIS